MSGGYFNYDQHRLNDIKQSIEELIRSNKDTSIDEFGDRLGKFFTLKLQSISFTKLWTGYPKLK
jgi:hypothetical protein